MNTYTLVTLLAVSFAVLGAPQNIQAEGENSKNILKQGLLGAGVGAISAEASGGKAGKGALIGAGTNVLGGALMDAFSGSGQPSTPAPAPRPRYRERQAPQDSYYEDEYYEDDYYEPVPPPRKRRVRRRPAPAPRPSNNSKNTLKQGLLGAGVGAISAEASGGKAGKGALIGAGTNVLGGALLDFLGGGNKTQDTYYEEPYEEEYYYEEEEEFYGEPGYSENSEPIKRRRRVIQQY